MDIMEIINLIVGLCGLVGAGIGAYQAVKFWVLGLKDKEATKVWSTVMEMADAAMKEAERSGKAGSDKKAMVIDAVQAGAKAAGLEIGGFLDQLDSYIDQTIAFVNAMKVKKTTTKVKE